VKGTYTVCTGYHPAIFRKTDMRLILISAAVTALFASSALAQPDHDHGPGGGGAPHAAAPPHGGGPGGAPHGGAPGGAPHGGPGGAPHGGPGGAPHPGPAAPAFSRGPNGGAAPAPAAPAFNRGPNGGNNFHPPGAPNAPGGFNRPGGAPNRGPGPGGARHNFSSFGDYHQNFNASRRFHAPAYQRPSGWYSHHWTFGETLPSLFWARNYWLTDYMDYALPPPPYGAVWVRVGPDALLIDEDSGEIITVEYGVFY
jgi:Ni/Co efflux regulator RcnB